MALAGGLRELSGPALEGDVTCPHGEFGPCPICGPPPARIYLNGKAAGLLRGHEMQLEYEPELEIADLASLTQPREVTLTVNLSPMRMLTEDAR